MKLSEMNVKQLAAALCDLTAPMSRIATDESLNGVFSDIAKKMHDGMTMFERAGMLMEAVPILFKKHYADTIRIIAVMTGRPDAEIEEMNGYRMIDEMRGCIDKQFLDFFRSSAVTDATQTVEGE